ncbi:MAG TPA: ATP-dependent DNA helicase RecQ, partial [Thermoanaerobaculia bacterium]|nr:ATP-dependent DNA helicase RecQ [Thermoanaerobaculia bacterium]
IYGRDVLAVMPTGSGKSIGYQLPALLLPGTTLVVSPLIALMKDQVDELNRRGIAAAAIHSLMPPGERQQVIDAARDGRCRLLYVSPERFANERFAAALAAVPLSRFAVDEAHCVSEWGHDFRPDYRRLAEAAARCVRADGSAGRPPILAFTATATPEVRDDIVDLLALENPEVFVAGFDRPNLFLDVRRVSGGLEKQAILAELVGSRRGLVYTATRKSSERAARALRSAGLSAEAYHAGLADAERTRVQNAFAAGTTRIVCATNAFGMGIDRPDVEVVVHYELPGSLEAYYQEIGRGGRDGRPADAVLLWNYVDVRTREFLIEREDEDDDPRRPKGPVDPVQRERRRELERKKLRRMIAYADSTGCHRATLLGYFGEKDVPPRCGACGNCGRRRALDSDQLLLLRKILSGVARGGERWGKRRIAAMLTGKLEGLPERLTGLSTTGLLEVESPRVVEEWIDAAVGAGFLAATDDSYRTLALTRMGREVMAGRVARVEMTLREPARERPTGRKRKGKSSDAAVSAGNVSDPVAADPALLGALRDWRREESARRGVPAYVVLHDRTLEALAAERPASLDALSEIPGIGPAKLAAYGPVLLSLLAPA